MLISVLAVLVAPGRANASATHRCWTVGRDAEALFRCRIGGTDLVDFAGPGVVGVLLYAAVGEDVWGECWFETDVWTGWTADGDWASPSAVLSYTAGESGGSIVLYGNIRRCSTDPAVTFDEVVAIRVMRAHDFQPPETTPWPRRGVVGLDAYLAATVSEAGRYEVGDVAGNEAVFVEIGVASIGVDWGDGSAPIAIAADRFSEMTGYPDGLARHRYRLPGVYQIELRVEWAARWRTSWDSSWHQVSIGASTDVTVFPVDQIVSRVIR